MSAPALLVHSGGFSPRQWRKLREALAPTRRVIAPELLGYGEHRWPAPRPFHFRQDVEMLAGLLDEPTHLVGHSYGGLLVLQLALARPELARSFAVYEPVAFGVLEAADDADALASIGALPTYQPDADGVDEAWLAGFVDWWNGPGSWARLPDDTRRSFRDVAWKLSEEVRTLGLDATTRAEYARITAPALVLGGAETQPAERRVVARLAAALPHATLRVFPGLGHMGPITHAAQINEAILAHIAAHDGATG